MQNFNKKVTRNDVAKLAGTSSAVVSYVINNGPKPVSEKTRRKVLEAIKITGYQPNNIARALVSGKSRCLGLIIPNISNPFIASLAHAIEGEAIDRGFVILLGDSDDREDKELDLLKFFLQRQVDGIIYNAIKDPYLDLLSSSNTPFVLLNHMASLAPGLRVVKINEYQASFDVVKMMIAKGYRKIAIICGPKSMHNTQERIRGWKSALISHGLNPDPALIFYSDYTRNDGYFAALDLIMNAQYDSVFTTNEMQAFGALRAFKERGIKVPDDIGMATFNATELSEFVVPSFAAMFQPVKLVAQHVLNMVLNHEVTDSVYNVPYIVKDGMSLRDH